MVERRALVVEVDAATQLGLLGFLRARGFQCVAVSSADEAQEALAEGSFSFTLVDLGGNGADATEMAQCLKLRGRNSGPIIAIASRRHGTVAAALEVDAVLHKPLSLDELQQAVDKLVRPQAEALGPEELAEASHPDRVEGVLRQHLREHAEGSDRRLQLVGHVPEEPRAEPREPPFAKRVAQKGHAASQG